MKTKVKKYLQVTVRLLISILALYFVFRNIDFSAFRRSLMNASLLLLTVASAFFVLSKVISAYRLKDFFSAGNISLGTKENLRLYWLGMFYNLFLPGGIGGDSYKMFYLRRKYNTPVKKSIISLLLDRITGFYALIVLCLVFLIFIPLKGVRLVYILPAIVFGTVGLYFIVSKIFGDYYGILTRTNLQSLGVQLSQVFAAWLILLALKGEQDISYLFVFLVSSVIAAIPFTIGGLGARELTFLYAADKLHLNASLSVTMSMMFFLITVIVSLFGVIFVLKPSAISEGTSSPAPSPEGER